MTGKPMSLMTPEEVRFQRLLMQRVERGEVSCNAGFYVDTADRFALASDEQVQLIAWRDDNVIAVDGQWVTVTT